MFPRWTVVRRSVRISGEGLELHRREGVNANKTTFFKILAADHCRPAPCMCRIRGMLGIRPQGSARRSGSELRRARRWIARRRIGLPGGWNVGARRWQSIHEIDSNCANVNFCDIKNNIHAMGQVTQEQVVLDSVFGSQLTFDYTSTANRLTLLSAGPGGIEIPLRVRSAAGLPSGCPTP